MMKVTVRFGKIRVIVPCGGDGELYIRDLIAAAIVRYRKATNKPPDSWVTVHKLKSLADGGILDPDDRLFDVVDDRDQILAIYDEQDPVSGGGSTSGASTSSPIPVFSSCDNNNGSSSRGWTESRPESIENSVEITSLNDPPPRGLTVRQDRERDGSLSTNGFRHSTKTSAFVSIPHSISEPTSLTVDSQTLSPPSDTDNNNMLSISGQHPNSNFMRDSARKSRLADKWFEAAEKIYDQHESKVLANDQQQYQTIEISVAIGQPVGISITPIKDESNGGKLRSVSIDRIHPGGRIAEDGRICVGDHIIEINGRPVYQMSIQRVQSYLLELAQSPKIIFTIYPGVRRPNVVATSSSSNVVSAPKRLVQSALQHANTTKIGRTLTIDLRKDERGGLGFTVTGRETTKGERLFYIKTVMPNSPAHDDGRLRHGDRLLEINGESLNGLVQAEVVDRLRLLPIGATVSLLISRMDDDVELPPPTTSSSITEPTISATSGQHSTSNIRVVSPSKPRQLPADAANGDQPMHQHMQTLTFDIALNDTGSAGLGVSVKGRTIEKPDGTRHDCGIFVKSVIHGGAAHKDGRLRVNDQLIGIESVDLAERNSNSEAMRLIGATMQRVGPNASCIQLRVARPFTTITAAKVHPTRNGVVEEGESILLDTLTRNNGIYRQQRVTGVQRTTGSEYNDYATIIKRNADTIERPIIIDDHDDEYQHKSLPSSNFYEDINDLSTVRIRDDDDEETTTLADDSSQADAMFNREAPGRRSMSEKRHAGAKSDPSHTLTYQRIKHQRQTSAPTLADNFIVVSSSNATPNRLLHPTSTDLNVLKQRQQQAPIPITANNSSNSPSSKRRSMSLESMSGRWPIATGTIQSQPPPIMIHEMAVGSSMQQQQRKAMAPSMKKVQRSRPTNDSFRQAVDRSYTGDNESTTTLVPDETPTVLLRTNNGFDSLPRSASATAAKDKQHRRKSVFGWLRFGSGRSREASPDGAGGKLPLSDGETDSQERARKVAEDERKRISEQYEKLKKQQQQQQSTTKMDVRPLPPPRSPIHHQPPPPHYISNRMMPQSHVVMPIGYPSSNPYGEAEGISEDYAYAPSLVRAENSRFYRSLDRDGRIARSAQGWHRPPITHIAAAAMNGTAIRCSATMSTNNQHRNRATSDLYQTQQLQVQHRNLPPPSTTMTHSMHGLPTPAVNIPPPLRPPRHSSSVHNSFTSNTNASDRVPSTTATTPLRRIGSSATDAFDCYRTPPSPAVTIASQNSSGRRRTEVAPELAAVDFDYRRLLRPARRDRPTNGGSAPPQQSEQPVSRRLGSTSFSVHYSDQDAPAFC